MQATTASGPHLDLSTNPDCPNAYDNERIAQIETVASRDTVPLLPSLTRLYNDVPSHSNATFGASTSSNDPGKSVYTESLFDTKPLSTSRSHSDEDFLKSGMHPAHPVFDENPPPYTLQNLSATPSEQAHRSDISAPAAVPEAVFEDVKSHKEDCGRPVSPDVLHELATDHLAITGLRSQAQEQGKKLRRLYNQFRNEAPSIVAALRELASADKHEKLALVSDQVEDIARLLDRIEDTRTAFHETQEHLSTQEWILGDREKEIFAHYTGKDAASRSIDALSVPPESSSRSNVSIPADIIHLGMSGLDRPAKVKDDLREVAVTSSTSENASFDASAGLSPNFDPTNTLPGPELGDAEQGFTLSDFLPYQSLHAPLSRKRVSLSAMALNPKDLTLLGSQFVSEPRYQASITSNRPRHIDLTADRSSVSSYNLPRLCRWFAFGVPWSSFTRGRRQRPYRLAEGVSAWQALAVNHFEATALGLSDSGLLDLVKDLETEQIGATRRSLIQSWFWDPKDRSNHSSSSIMAVSEAEQTSMPLSQMTSMRRTPVAATAPYLGGSPSSTVQLEDGGKSNGMVDSKWRFTSAPHGPLSDQGVQRHSSKRRRPA